MLCEAYKYPLILPAMTVKTTSTIDWLTEELLSDVRSVFEKRYDRQLETNEIKDIANSLCNYVELAITTQTKEK